MGCALGAGLYADLCRSEGRLRGLGRCQHERHKQEQQDGFSLYRMTIHSACLDNL